MMRSCGVCFVRRKRDAKAGVEAEYIAPELLPRREEIEREIAAQWDADTTVETQEYAYQFLHQGLIRAIIAEIGSQAGISALYWREGLCAYEETTRSRALIEQQMDEGRWWAGSSSKRAADERGSCFRDSPSSSSGSRIESGSKAFARRSNFPAPEEARSEKTPLAFGAERSPTPRFYVSYAWADPTDPDRETIVNQACEEAEKRGTAIIRDKTTLYFGDDIAKFMRAIGEGDRVFVIPERQIFEIAILHVRAVRNRRNSRQDKAEFLRRVRIYTLGDAKIWKPSIA